MPELRQCEEVLLTHPLTPAGPIPSVGDPEGVYPYETWVETSARPVLRRFHFWVIENAHLRVVVCPELGGKVHSLFDKPGGKETLFQPLSVQPVRILPRLGFVPGGIEVSFPIAHTPVQLETVACEAGIVDGRAYVSCGEQELRFGMQWTVEYSLGEDDTYLTQRVSLWNGTPRAHPWTSWSNAAVPARPDTEFHFPGGPVLYHGDVVRTIDWATEGPRRVADLNRMAGFFWRQPDAKAFGAFTPSLGLGLYHLADPALAPGIKLWSYGLGPHEPWGQAASLSGETYVEIQGGPIRDQSIKELLRPEQRRHHTEFWQPAGEPLNLHRLELPAPKLRGLDGMPRFGWPPRPAVDYWTAVLAAHAQAASAKLPSPPPLESNWWAPSGMESLGPALAWAERVTDGAERGGWQFQLGAWLAGRDDLPAALDVLARSSDERALALAGRLHLRSRQNPQAAVECFRALRHPALALHPQVVVERDLALADLGSETLAERETWLARIGHCEDEWVVERQVAWLADTGRCREARELLERTRFQSVHQRYERTRQWRRLTERLGESAAAPASLGEDDLARFGAYREYASKD